PRQERVGAVTMMRVHTDWLLTAARAALHLPTATAVLADLHLGYAQARRRRGEAVPDRSLDELFAALAPVLGQHGVRRVVIAGDLFEEAWCDELVEQLLRWSVAVRLEGVCLIPGNHDRGIPAEAGRVVVCR